MFRLRSNDSGFIRCIITVFSFAGPLSVPTSGQSTPISLPKGHETSSIDQIARSPALTTMRQIERQLEQIRPLRMPQRMTLAQLVDYLNRLRIHAALDIRALEDVGADDETHIDLPSARISLGRSLALALDPLGLQVAVTAEVLLITTKEEGAELLISVTYDVTRLVEHVDQVHEIMNLLEATVAPDSWDTVGGPGSQAYHFLGGRTALVVNNSRENHREIESVLRQIDSVVGVDGPRQPRSSRRRESTPSGSSVVSLPAPPPRYGINAPGNNSKSNFGGGFGGGGFGGSFSGGGGVFNR